MPESKIIVTDTAPLISLVAALGDLTVLQMLYDEVLVPFEVCQEMLAGGTTGLAVAEFKAANWLRKWPNSVVISPSLLNSLDRGEAAVIKLAIREKITTVCIDELAGRQANSKTKRPFSNGLSGYFAACQARRLPLVDAGSNSTHDE